ncbi:MAG: sulfatase-like hydrolase/transferase, partial [Thermoanaerobaculia bacterium]
MVQRLTSVAQPARAFTTSDPADWTALEVVPSARAGVPLWTAPPSNDPSAIVTAEGDRAIVAPSASQLFLERPLAIDTLGVDRIRLAVEKDVFDSVELCWAAAGQPFADERCSFQSVSETAPGTLDFELAKEPLWIGAIDRLAVRWTIAGTPPRLGPLTLLAETATTAASPIPEGAARAELRGVSRGVWVAPAGSERTVTHETGTGERLRFAYGASETRRDPLRFTLDAGADADSRVELFADTVTPRRTGDDPGWREAEVDLGRFAGQTIELRFAVGGTGPENAAGDRGVGYWGSIEITAPAPDHDPPRPNVILISIDTLRADRMSLYGYGRTTTPRIEAWARDRAAVFRDVTAAAPWTLPSHVSIFSGESALVHGVNRLGPIPPSLPLLAERFAAAGYRTRATTAGAMTAPHFGFAR